jgi:hypothetical protein
MVGTISPVVYGPRHRWSWSRLIGVYTLSQIAGACLTGLLLGGIGLLLRALIRWESATLTPLFTMLAAFGALSDLKLLPLPLPSRCWQVPQSWKRFSPGIMASCFGFGIGVGVLTRIPFASFYLVLAVCAGSASLPLGVVLMALYGMTRAASVAVVAHGQGCAPDPCARLMTITRLTPLIGYLDGLVLAFVTGVFLLQAVRAHLL